MGSVSHAHQNGSVGPDTLQAGLQELADICHQLYTSAELHEKQYLSANDRKHALQNTQQFAVMALTKVADRVASTMRGLETQINTLLDTTASSERSINVLTTRLHGCHAYLDQLEWQRLRQQKPCLRLPKHAPIHADVGSVEAQTVVATPTEAELFDFGMFDSIGTSLGRTATTPRAGLTGGGTLSMVSASVGSSPFQQLRPDPPEGTGAKGRVVPPPPPPAPSTTARSEDSLKPAGTAMPSPTVHAHPPAPPPPPPPPSILARLDEATKVDSYGSPLPNVPSSPRPPPPPAPPPPPPPIFVSGKDSTSAPPLPPPPPPPSVLARLDEATKVDSYASPSTNAPSSPRPPPPPPPPPPPMFVSGKDSMSVPPPPPPPPAMLARLEGTAKLSPNQPPPPPPPSLSLGLSSGKPAEQVSHTSIPALAPPASLVQSNPGADVADSLPSRPHSSMSLPLTTQATPLEAQLAQSESILVPPSSAPQFGHGPFSLASIAQAAARLRPTAASPMPPPQPPVAGPVSLAPAAQPSAGLRTAAISSMPPPPTPAGPMQKFALLQQGPTASPLKLRSSTSIPSITLQPPPPAALKPTPPPPPPPPPAQMEPTSPAQTAGSPPPRPLSSQLMPSAPSAATSNPSPSSLPLSPPPPPPLGLAKLKPASLRQVVPLASASPPQVTPAAPGSPNPPPPPPTSPTLKPLPQSPRWSPQAPAASEVESTTETQANAPPPPPPPPPYSPPPSQLKPASSSSASERQPLLPATAAAVKPAPSVAPVPPLVMQQPIPSSQVHPSPLPSPPLPPPPPPPASTDIFASRGRPPPLPSAIQSMQDTAGSSASPRAPSVPVHTEPGSVMATHAHPPPPPQPPLVPALAHLRPTAPMPTTSVPRPATMPQAIVPSPTSPTPALAALTSTMPQSQTPPAVPVQLKPTIMAGPPPPPPPPPPPHAASLPPPPQLVALSTLRSTGSHTAMSQHLQSVDAPVQLKPLPVTPPVPPTPPVMAMLKPIAISQASSTSPPQSPSALLKPSSNTPAPAQLGVGAKIPASPSPRSMEMTNNAASAASTQPASPAALLARAMQSRGQPDGVSLEQIRNVQLRPTTPKQKVVVESGDCSPVSAALRSWQSKEASAVPTTPQATVQALRNKLLADASPSNSPKSAQQSHNDNDGVKGTALTSKKRVTSGMVAETTHQQCNESPVDSPTSHHVTVTQQQSPRPAAGLKLTGLQGERAQHDEGQTAETNSMPAWAKLKSSSPTIRGTAETQIQSHTNSLNQGPVTAVHQAATAGFVAKQTAAATSGQKLVSSPTAGFQLPQKGNQNAAAEQQSGSTPAWARLKPTASPARTVDKTEPTDDDAETESETATMPAWAKLKQTSTSPQSSSQEFVVKIQFDKSLPTSPGKRGTLVAKQSTHGSAGHEQDKTNSSSASANRVTASPAVQQALAGLLTSPRSSSVDRQAGVVMDSHELSPVHSRPEAGLAVKTGHASEGNLFLSSQVAAAARSVQHALAALQPTTSPTASDRSQRATGAKSPPPPPPPPPPPAPHSPAVSVSSKPTEPGVIDKQQSSRPAPPPPPPMPRPASTTLHQQN